MKILVLSDLHLESAKFAPSVDAGVDVVVLAGDIAPGLRGLSWARETFSSREIVYVAGILVGCCCPVGLDSGGLLRQSKRT